jgi:two-component system sensor histidine kinase RegB
MSRLLIIAEDPEHAAEVRRLLEQHGLSDEILVHADPARDVDAHHKLHRLAQVGTLAAGAAHEIAQPMATMSLLVSEMEERCGNCPGMGELVRHARQQVDTCRDTLGSLLSYGRSSFDTRTDVLPVDEFLRICLAVFRTRRPGASATLVVDSNGAAPGIRHDLALRQAVLNLLGNAADVSPQWIQLHVHWDDEEVTLSVLDRGPGIAPDVQQQLGKMFFTTKRAGAGNGLGLNLAHTAVARLGGALSLGNAPDGGACARIVLPVESPAQAAPPARSPRARPA